MVIKERQVVSKLTLICCLMILNKVDGKNCNFNVQIEQILLNEGFHRNLSINIDFASDSEEERWLYEECMVGVEQTLPAGVYSSIDDINENGCKSLIHSIFKTPVNIELPAMMSDPIVIHMLSKVIGYNTHIYIPVHARYHHAVTGGGTVKNEVPVPKLYLLCPNNKLEQCKDLYSEVTRPNNFCAESITNEECSWKEIPIIMVSAPVTWEVPIGNTDHCHLVTCGTAVVIVVGSLYLLNTLHQHKMHVQRSHKKKLCE